MHKEIKLCWLISQLGLFLLVRERERESFVEYLGGTQAEWRERIDLLRLKAIFFVDSVLFPQATTWKVHTPMIVPLVLACNAVCSYLSRT